MHISELQHVAGDLFSRVIPVLATLTSYHCPHRKSVEEVCVKWQKTKVADPVISQGPRWSYVKKVFGRYVDAESSSVLGLWNPTYGMELKLITCLFIWCFYKVLGDAYLGFWFLVGLFIFTFGSYCNFYCNFFFYQWKNMFSCEEKKKRKNQETSLETYKSNF